MTYTGGVLLLVFLVGPLSVALANWRCTQDSSPAAISLSTIPAGQEVLRTLKRGSVEDIRALLEQEGGSSRVNIAMRHLARLPRPKRRQRHKYVFKALTFLEGNKSQALVWLHRSIDPDLCTIIISDINFASTCFQGLEDKSEDAVEVVKSLKVPACIQTLTCPPASIQTLTCPPAFCQSVTCPPSGCLPQLNCLNSASNSQDDDPSSSCLPSCLSGLTTCGRCQSSSSGLSQPACENISGHLNSCTNRISSCWKSFTSFISTGSKIVFRYLASLMTLRTAVVLICYVDLLKDSILQVNLTMILGNTLVTHFSSVASQLYWLLLVSIILPLVSSALATACREPFLVLGQRSWQYHKENTPSSCRLWGMRFFTFFLYFWVPAQLLEAQEGALTRREELLEEGTQQTPDSEEDDVSESILKEGEQVTKYLEAVRKNLLTFKRNELCIEAMLQLTCQTIMLLLSLPSSTTKYGLEAVFKVDFEEKKGWLSWAGLGVSQVLLMSSIAWSFTTTARTFIKIKGQEKVTSIPFLGKCTLAIRALLVFTCRIFTIIAFFGPFLGLLGTLAHHTAEKISLKKETFLQLPSDFEYWDKDSGRAATVAKSLLYRSDYSGNTTIPIPPDETRYTGINLQSAYITFLSLLVLQALIILSLKTKMSKQFSKAFWANKLQHVVECLSLPEAFADWDDDEGSVEDLRKRRMDVFKEISATSALQLVTNMLLLVPLFYAGRTLADQSSPNYSMLPGFRILERHNNILPAIGAFQEEKDAFSLVQLLVWAAPLTVLLATLGDLFLSWAYLWFFHPWIDILAKVGHGR